jgi:hypothetical protein
MICCVCTTRVWKMKNSMRTTESILAAAGAAAAVLHCHDFMGLHIFQLQCDENSMHTVIGAAGAAYF